MSEKILIAPVGGAANFETGAVTVSDQRSWDMDNGGTPVTWNASGSIIQVWLAPGPTGNVFHPGFVIDIDARGVRGEAQLMIVARAIIEPTKPSTNCRCGPKGGLERKDLTNTFTDRSMLFATLEEGWFPVRSDPAVFRLKIAGGTGRYEAAIGRLNCTFRGLRFGNFGLLLVETGNIAGEIFW